MTTAATIQANLILDSSQFTSGIDKASGSAKRFASDMQTMGATMQRVGAGMTVALTVPIVAFGISAVKSAMDSEMAMTELETVIKSTGGAAGLTAKEISDMANELQNVTMFSDEAIMKGQSMLLTFTKIGKETFPEATTAMLNMAQKFGSVDAAAVQLGKALQDPIAGVTALRRVGVMLTDAQEQQIKQFMAVGDIASAQKIILQELETEFGGLAVAAGQTAAGQMAIFNNKLDTMKEALGAAIIPSLIAFMDALTPVIQAIADAPPWVQQMIVAFLGLVAISGPILSIAGTVVSLIGTLSSLGVTMAGVSTAFAGVAAVVTGTLIPAIIAILPILLLIAATVALVYLVWSNWDQLGTTVQQLWAIIKIEFMNGVNAIAANFESVKTTISSFVDAALSAWNTVTSAFSNAFSTIQGIAQSVFGAITGAIQSVINYIYELISALGSIVLPDALTPGSPTPFEMGLRGIGGAMETISKKAAPDMNKALGAPQGITAAGQSNNVSIVDNRRFSGGMGADELRTAMDNKLLGLTEALA